MLNNALFLDPSPKPVSANLFKQGGPSVNGATIFVSTTSYLKFFASLMIESLVIPGRIVPDNSGVYNILFFMQKKFAAPTSSTYLSVMSK